MTSEGGRGTLIIRDVKEADQGAYTCEAMNSRGMVFGIPDGVLELVPQRGAVDRQAGVGGWVGDWHQSFRTSNHRPSHPSKQGPAPMGTSTWRTVPPACPASALE